MSYPGKVFFANMAHDVFLCLPGPLVELSIPVHRPSRDNFPSPPPPPLYPLSPFPSSAEYAVYAVYAEYAEYAEYSEMRHIKNIAKGTTDPGIIHAKNV